MVARAYKVAEKLKSEGYEPDVINARFLKPIDENMIVESVRRTKKVVTIEDNALYAGLRTMVLDVLNKNNICDIKVISFGYPDEFIKQGTVEQIEKKYGLNEKQIFDSILKNVMGK